MIKQISYYMLISMIAAAIVFLTSIYLSRLLSPEEYAYLGLLETIKYILIPMSSFCATPLIGINIVKLNKIEYKHFINTYISFTICLTIVLFIIVMIVGMCLPIYQEFIMYAYFVSISTILINIHNVELIQLKNIKFFGIYKIFLVIANFLAVFLFIELFEMSWQGRILGLFISNILLLFIMYIFTYKTLNEFKFVLDLACFKEYLKFGFPLVFGLLAGWIISHLDKYLVLYFFTLENLGYYSLGYTIGISLTLVNQSVVNAIAPKIYTLLRDGVGKKIIEKYSRYYNIFISILVLFCCLIINYFGDVIFGSQYSKSLNIIMLILVAVAFDGMYRIYGLVFQYFKENFLRTKIEYLTAGLNIIFSISLIPILGILAPAVGTIVSYFFAYLLYRYFAKKILIKQEVK